MNCRNLILTNFKLDVNIFNQYLDGISSMFNLKNQENTHVLEVVHHQQFVEKVLADPKNVGICLGGSGIPESVYLNQKPGIRAALAHTKYIAQMCRKHNDANVMIISTDCIGVKLAADLSSDYLLSGFDNQERNMLRIEKMKEMDAKYWQK